MAASLEPKAVTVVDGRFALDGDGTTGGGGRRGGMGTVWKARDLRFDRPVALKILHLDSAEQAERFAREGQLLADLAHPSIVAYVAHGATAEGAPYLVMEWLDGENVADRLARQRLTLTETVALMRSAAGGLAVAHRRGIVHRDVKPSNLFLRQGRVDDVVLLDLGIGRYLGGGKDLTRTGSILGTPSYMAPEQAQGHSDVGPGADVFSLGCVLYECLTGEPPFVGTHVFSVLAKVLFEEVPRLRDVRPDMPAAVDALCAAALAKDPARRLTDAEALLAALNAVGVPTEVEPPTAAGAVATGASASVRRRAGGAEQELVSVILATRNAGAPAGATPPVEGPGPTLPPDAAEATLLDVAAYGGEMKQLADGATVITLAQRGGAATDLAARAARCALRLRDRRPGWTIALATGRGIPNERSYIGEAVDRAALLLRSGGVDGEGGPGHIRIDEVTAGLLDARFLTNRLDGTGEGDGDDGRGRVGGAIFVLEAEAPSIDPARRLLGRPTACVGRDHEIGMLELALRASVEDESPRAVLVVGPPGMGKSRLRHELLRHVQQRGDDVVAMVGLGDPIRTSTTRGLLGDAVARLVGLRADAPDDHSRAALEERIGRPLAGAGTAERRRVTVFMGELCGIRYPGDAVPELRGAQQDPRIMADMVAQAWITFLRAEAAAHPVLLVLDDLQWSDALTVSLVGLALRELTSSRLMVLALARPEVTELYPDLWAPRLTTMPLGPLRAGVTARFIRQALGDRVSDDTITRMVSRAAGNALYLEELIRAADARREGVPETVLAMLQARIGLLPPAPRRVLRAAAVFGEIFPLAGVTALLRAADTDEDLEATLAVLTKHEILEAHEGERADGRWRFRHALMRDAAYGLFTEDDRRASHTEAAHFLEAAGEDPAVLASHHARGTQPAAAVRHYVAAAQGAFGRNDLAGAVALVEAALACGASGVERGVLRSIEAGGRFYQNDFAKAWDVSAEAVALLPAGHPERVSALAWNLYAGFHTGRSGELERQAAEILMVEPREDQRADYVLAVGWGLITYTANGNRGRALPLVARVSAIGDQANDPDALVTGHVLYWKTRYAQLLGDDPYQMWLDAQAGVRSYQRNGDRRMLAYMLVEVGECARRLYSVEQGIAGMRPAVELAGQLGEAVTGAFIQQYLAVLLAEHGADADQAEARALVRSVLELTSGGGVYHAFGQIAQALVSLRAGELDAADRAAREAHATIHKMDVGAYFPHVDVALMRVLLARGDGAAAAALADTARAHTEARGPMGLMDLSLRLWVARAYVAVGRRQDAGGVMAGAQARLAARAARIPDPAMRAAFFTRVPEHAGLAALASDLGFGPASSLT